MGNVGRLLPSGPSRLQLQTSPSKETMDGRRRRTGSPRAARRAAALLARRAGDRISVLSSGSDHADTLNPAVVAVLADWGIDISAESSKQLAENVARQADVVLTMGCSDDCPVYSGKRYGDWDMPDPGGQAAPDVRPIRDEIAARVDVLIDELIGADSM
jgi:arsenate reductase (thioredoxin)